MHSQGLRSGLRFVFALAASLVTAAVLLPSGAGAAPKAPRNLPETLKFTLVDQNGAAFTEADLTARPSVIHFGYTSCPVICPTTLYETAAHMRELGALADRVNFIFVTVDPERDTPQHMKTYVQSFDARIIALSGKQEDIAALAAALGAIYARVQGANGDYTMDHTVNGFIVEPARATVGELYMGAGSRQDLVVRTLAELAARAPRGIGAADASGHLR